MKRDGVIFLVLGWLALLALSPLLALTPTERTVLEHARSELLAGMQHGETLKKELEDARHEIGIANQAADLATKSAITAGEKAKTAEAQAKQQYEELKRCATENESMRSIVKQVSGPWWFPGLNALIYGIKKSTLSLIVIVAGLAVIGLLLKFFAPGVLTFLGVTWKAIVGLFRRAANTLKPKP